MCAGLWADRLARASGASADPRIVPFRGAYLRLVREGAPTVRGMIYPVPDPDLPFLGVHVTRHIDGHVMLGPTAMMVPARDGYRLNRWRARDLAESAAWPGSWRLARRFWRTGLTEVRMATSKKAFVAAAAAYVPGLTRSTSTAPSTPGSVLRRWGVTVRSSTTSSSHRSAPSVTCATPPRRRPPPPWPSDARSSTGSAGSRHRGDLGADSIEHSNRQRSSRRRSGPGHRAPLASGGGEHG